MVHFAAHTFLTKSFQRDEDPHNLPTNMYSPKMTYMIDPYGKTRNGESRSWPKQLHANRIRALIFGLVIDSRRPMHVPDHSANTCRFSLRTSSIGTIGHVLRMQRLADHNMQTEKQIVTLRKLAELGQWLLILDSTITAMTKCLRKFIAIWLNHK